MPGGEQQPTPAKMLADKTESWAQPWPHEARILEGREVCDLNQLLAWEQAKGVTLGRKRMWPSLAPLGTPNSIHHNIIETRGWSLVGRTLV